MSKKSVQFNDSAKKEDGFFNKEKGFWSKPSDELELIKTSIEKEFSGVIFELLGIDVLKYELDEISIVVNSILERVNIEELTPKVKMINVIL